MKRCAKCNCDKPESEYYARDRACKTCRIAAVKQRRLTNPAVREYDRQRAKLPRRIAQRVRNTQLWRERNPDGYRAQTAVGNALRDGKIVREPCGVCASTENVHAHHKDYSKPLEVVWLCARCHHRLHALFPELEGKNKKVVA